MDEHGCRACRGRTGDIVLDLGDQRASDYFPSVDSKGPIRFTHWRCGFAHRAVSPNC